MKAFYILFTTLLAWQHVRDLSKTDLELAYFWAAILTAYILGAVFKMIKDLKNDYDEFGER